MADQDYRKELEQAKADINSIVLELKKVDQQLIATSKLAREMGLAFKPTSPNEMNTQLQKQKDIISQLNEELTKLKNKTSELNTVKQRQKNITSEEIIGQRQLKKSADLQATAISKMVGAYQRLIAKRKQAKKTLQDLIVSEKASTIQIKRAQREYDKLTTKVNKANKATSNFAKTGLGGIVRGFRNLLGAFGIVGGIMMFSTMAKSVFQLTKTLNSMDFAMRAVIKDADEYAQTQEFLEQITNNFGAELVTTTNRYIKFRAASQQAGLSAKETQKIFGTMTKAAGVLGLRTEELTGIYLALEQMISKGKITTEELRRQLGERLPGAMDIMANSLGVTTSQLDAMLKKGQVITKDVLPGFARQVEIAFGIQSVKRVDTLQASTIRLQNAWTNFVKNMEGSKKTLSGFFTTIIDGLTSVLEGYKSLSGAQSEYVTKIKDEQVELNKLVAEIISTNEEEEQRGVLIDALLEKYPFFLQALKDEKTDNDSLRDALDRVNNMYIKRLAIRRIEEQLDMEGSRQREAKALADLATNQKAYNDFIIDINTQLKGDISGRIGRNLQETADNVIKALKRIRDEQLDIPGAKTTLLFEVENLLDRVFEAQRNLAGSNFMKDISEDIRKGIESQVAEFEKLLGITGKQIDEYFNLGEIVIKTSKKEQKFAEGTVGWLKEKISANKKLILQSKDRSQIKQWQDQNDEWQKAIDLLLGVSKALKKVSKVVKNSEKDWEANIKALKEQRANLELNSFAWDLLDTVIKGMEIGFKKLKGAMDLKDEGENLREIFEGLTETFSDVFDIDISKFDFLFDGLENSISDWADLSKELIGSVLDASLRRYELELIEAQRTRDLILNNELASSEEKEAARRQFEEKERRIRNESAKQERDNALIKIAVDTAVAVVKALSQTGILAPFVIPGIIAIGLAQAAIVAAQPLPEFKEGTKSAPKGWALTQEKRAEPITDKYGRLKTMGTKGGAMFTPLEKGDRVFRSQDEFFNQYGGDAIHKAVWSMNMASNGRELSKKIVDNSLLNETKGLRKDIDIMGRRIGKLASRPVNVHNVVEIEDKRAY